MRWCRRCALTGADARTRLERLVARLGGNPDTVEQRHGTLAHAKEHLVTDTARNDRRIHRRSAFFARPLPATS